MDGSSVTDEDLARLVAAAGPVRASRYQRHSLWCGGSERVPDGVDPRLLQAWLDECLNYARRVHGPQSQLAVRLSMRLGREASIEELEGALADFRAAGGAHNR